MATDPIIEEYEKHLDVSLLLRNLERTPQERLDAMISMIELEIFGRRCRCIDLESLIRIERAVGRPKDFEAIAELEFLLGKRRT